MLWEMTNWFLPPLHPKKTGEGGGGSPRLFLPKRRSREKLPEKQNERVGGRRRRPTKALQSFSIPFPRRNHFPPSFSFSSFASLFEGGGEKSFFRPSLEIRDPFSYIEGRRKEKQFKPPSPPLDIPTHNPPPPLFSDKVLGAGEE